MKVGDDVWTLVEEETGGGGAAPQCQRAIDTK